MEFEEQIRNSLLIEKLVEQSLALVKISEKELEQAYSKENDTAQVTYILIKEEDFKNDIKISKESLEKFYQKNKENFKKPQQVNVKYIKVDFSSQKEKINITEEEIKDYYGEHKEEFKIVAEEKKNEGTPAYQTLDEVKEKIKDIILANKAQEKALELAYEVSDFLYEGKSLEEASQKFSLPIGETGFFSSLESIPEVGWSYQFLMAAFKLEKGQISDIVQTPKGYYILQLIAKKEPYIPPLDEIKNKVKDALIKEKAKAKAKEKAENMLTILKKEKNKKDFNFAQATKALGFTAQSTKSFKRDDYIPNIGESKKFTEEVFKLKVGEISGIIEVPKGYVILKVDEKKPFDRKKFAEEKESFRNKLLTQKRQKYFLEWFKNLKEKANLKSNLSSMPKE
jgi:peptidyl-prolyl cis-trans isomerase D